MVCYEVWVDVTAHLLFDKNQLSIRLFPSECAFHCQNLTRRRLSIRSKYKKDFSGAQFLIVAWPLQALPTVNSWQHAQARLHKLYYVPVIWFTLTFLLDPLIWYRLHLPLTSINVDHFRVKCILMNRIRMKW